jgi:two-component system cell cycle response regulator
MSVRLTGSLIVIDGEDLGRRYDLDIARTIGRERDNDICLDHDSVSRHHAEIFADETGVRLRDLRSTNGTYVNETKVRQVYLNDGDTIKIGRTTLKYLNSENTEILYHEVLYIRGNIDHISGIRNRQSFDEKLANEVLRARAGCAAPTLLLLDIDQFGRCNHVWGRGAGNDVLRDIAGLLQQSMYPHDFVARYGGDKFAIILHGVDQVGGIRFAEHLRSMIQGHTFTLEDDSIKMTISIGTAVWSTEHDDVDKLLVSAEASLYRAKRAGGNRVVFDARRTIEPDELTILFSGDSIEPAVVARFVRALCASFEADTGSTMLAADEWRIRSRPGLLAPWFRKVCGVWNDDGHNLGVPAPILTLTAEKHRLREHNYRVFMSAESHHVIVTRPNITVPLTVQSVRITEFHK